MIFGKIDVEQASHTILPHTFGPDATDVQLRKYDAHVLARVPASKVNENAQFRVLAKYIGVFGQPENTNTAADGDNGGNGGSKIAMTAPVLSSTSSSQSSPQKIAMTAPVLSSTSSSSHSDMAFVLPAQYKTSADAPTPTDVRVELINVSERHVAVKTFSGLVTMETAEKMANEFKQSLEEQGFQTKTWQLARYNPPFTLWFLRTNEIWMDVDSDSLPPFNNSNL